MIDKVRLKRNSAVLTIYLDSSHSCTFGNQENTNYNTYYGTASYYPLVAFDGLYSGLQSESIYTSDGVKIFQSYCLSTTLNNLLARIFSFEETIVLRLQNFVKEAAGLHQIYHSSN